MVFKNKKSRTAIPGYTLIPQGDHHQIRKIGMTRERIKTDPAYNITRLLSAEFGKAARLGKLIRAALLPGTGIKNKATPLTTALLKALQADKETPLGQRDFITTDFTGLAGFNCNEGTALHDCLSANIEVQWSHEKKQSMVTIPSFIPAQAITAPEGITHARIFSITAIIDTVQQTVEKKTGKTTLIPLKRIMVNEKRIATEVTVKEGQLIIIAVGITWYQAGKNKAVLTVSKTPGPLAILKAL